MRTLRAAGPWILMLALSGSGIAQAAAPISGQFVIGGKKLALSEVAAFRMRDTFNPRAFETYVMLTAKPVDRAAIGASIDPYSLAINDPAVHDADYIGLSVGGDGKVSVNARVGGVQYIDSTGKIMGQPGSLVANCRENTATRIACNVKTKAPVKSMNGPTWSMDLTFESDVVSRKPGKPLGKDGEAPGKAFLALRAAVEGKDLAKILALLTPDQAKSYQEDWRSPAENLESAKDILGARMPKKPKITGGELVADDYAVLEIEGVPYDDGRMLYLVEMRRVNGKWLYEDSSVVGMLR
jgi:hypothetical protein